ncbi:iron-sulfur cluster assembly accessory protein [Sphaerothrix gracilis]|uniref:HesB/IscA family protein n=1 Tax=Sphaerothrix gracilis TaxID=3151835 RepID=UPI0031FC5219
MIHLSPAAAREISRLQSQSTEARCRIGFEPGGCLQWYYTLSFDQSSAASDDIVYHSNGVQIVVGSQHVPHLEGLTIDYSEDLMGSSFRFHNPNASEHCGCGSSFSVGLAS